MSALVAAGCARSRFQSVSVVPMIQCDFHGMTNSTDFSVLRMMPLSEVIRSRATTRCTPLDARTRNRPRPPDSRCSSSVQTPVELITTRALTSVSAPVSTSRTRTPATRSDSLRNADHLGRGPDHRAVGGGGAGHRHGVPGVVDLPVVVLDPADQRVPAQARHQPQRGGLGQVLVPGHRPGAAHRVVHDQPGADIRPLDHVLGQRVQERHRLGQVRADLGEHQFAFPQRLADQPELEHLQIPQAAVEQLGRPGRGAGGQVPRLDQRDGQPAGDGVERRAGADDAAADHHDVERLPAEPLEAGRPLGRAEPGAGVVRRVPGVAVIG